MVQETAEDAQHQVATAVAEDQLNTRKSLSTSRTALVLYGSETGNAQDVADEIGRLTERLRFETVILDLDSIDLRDLLKYTIVIFSISTAGQGEFPQNARSFWKTLLSSRLRPGILRRMSFSSFGLGDSSYPRFNVAHRMLHGRLLQLGGQLFCQRGEGNEQHPEGHSAEFRTWIVDLKEALIQNFPLPGDQAFLAEDTFLEPKWKLKFTEKAHDQEGSASKVNDNAFAFDAPPDSTLVPVTGSILADLTSNERVTPLDHFQDVRLMDLTLDSQATYGPGAVAVIYPKNFPADVEEFIKCQGWEAVADAPVELVPTPVNTSMMSPSPLRHVETSDSLITLRVLLTNYLDILSIPRRSFFSSLAYFTKSGNEDEQYQRDRIFELANPELIDELWDYTTRPRRTILEIMPDFPSVKIPWEYACSILPVMRGRQFSIASGGEMSHVSVTSKNDSDRDRKWRTRVQLLVAIADPPNPIIKYRKRYGVCTRYIATLQPGQRLNVGLQPGYLGLKPKDYESPMILIAPGTGIAPMRSLLYDRLRCFRNGQLSYREKPLQGCMLFFGCRDRNADFFFRDDWTVMRNEGLQVIVAPSREKDVPRKYVQDMLREEGGSVFPAISSQQGRIFVCGSSGHMPKGVRQALVDVVKIHGDMKSNDEAENFLDDLEKAGRYKQETW